MANGAIDENAETRIRNWIETHIGPVGRMERQGRWRPSWFVDVVSGAQTLNLYVRGARPGDWPPMPLEYEGKVIQVFEKSGLRVPHVHGYIDDAVAIVMDRARGRTNLNTAASEADREAIRSQLIEQMALMHQIDPERLEEIGAPRPTDPAEVALTYYRLIENLFLRNGAVAPAADFVRRWLNRNVPANPEGARPIAVDAAQFLFEQDRLTAILDFEFASLGDYHTDLAALRIRNRAEYIGDVDQLIGTYMKRSGLPVDPYRIRYHTAMIAILTPLQVAKELARPGSQIDYHEYLTWNAFCTLIALDCIAEIRGWTPQSFEPPSLVWPSRQALSVDALALSIDESRTENEFARYRNRKRVLTLNYIARADAHRKSFEYEYLADAAQILGRMPTDWREADIEIARLVAQENEPHEEALWRLFTRRYLWDCFLLADPADTMNYEQLSTRIKPFAPLST